MIDGGWHFAGLLSVSFRRLVTSARFQTRDTSINALSLSLFLSLWFLFPSLWLNTTACQRRQIYRDAWDCCAKNSRGRALPLVTPRRGNAWALKSTRSPFCKPLLAVAAVTYIPGCTVWNRPMRFFQRTFVPRAKNVRRRWKL